MEANLPVEATALRLRVLYADTDGMGIVYHGRYFPWLEDGRDAYLRAHGYPYAALEADGVGLVVIDTQARFRAPARYDDQVVVYTWLRELGRVRVRFAFRVIHEASGQVLVEAETTYAFVDRAGVPIRITHYPAVWSRLQALRPAPAPS